MSCPLILHSFNRFFGARAQSPWNVFKLRVIVIFSVSAAVLIYREAGMLEYLHSGANMPCQGDFELRARFCCPPPRALYSSRCFSMASGVKGLGRVINAVTTSASLAAPG